MLRNSRVGSGRVKRLSDLAGWVGSGEERGASIARIRLLLCLSRLTRLTLPRLPPLRSRLLARAEAVCVGVARRDLAREMSGIDVGGGDSLDASLDAPEVRAFARRGEGGGVCTHDSITYLFFY